MKFQLKTRQICLFFIAFTPVIKLFMMPSIIAEFAREDMWISSLINLILDGVTFIFLLIAARRAKTNVFGLLEDNFGKTGAKTILAFYVVYFMLKAIVPLGEQKDYVELTLYTLMPSQLYFLPFFGVAFYLCVKYLRVIGRSADVLWLLTAVGLIILFALSIPNAEFESVLPIGASGIKNILKGSYYTLNWYGDCVYLMFFIGEFDYKKKDGIKIFISYAIAALAVIIFMIIFYSVFTSIAFRQRFALTEISKYTAVINNIGRFDYVGITFILFSNAFALSLPLYFSCRILNYIFGITKKWIAPIFVIGIQLLIMVFLTQFYASIESIMKNYLGIFFFIFGNILPIVTAFLKNKEKANENDA
ncbi:MAG: GerAB/ArcD/ProY family transporter [Clostridia bacterium]|nr:GerAB/ArcD/ProY family transporter [Clostridia bacterium]